MCVIASMPKRKRLSDNDIMTMFAANPDGAGLCYPHNGRVIIRKGFFTVEELLKAYHSVPKNAPVIVHCRIATSGGISERTCHPFALGDGVKRMDSRSCNFAIAHNGVLSGLGSNKMSDTQEYITRVLRPLRQLTNAETVAELDCGAGTVIEATLQDNRMIIMDKRGSVVLYGKWHKYNGCAISNKLFTNYKLYKLPFDDCKVCAGRYDCAAFGAFCETSEDVADSFDYYGGVYCID